MLVLVLVDEGEKRMKSDEKFSHSQRKKEEEDAKERKEERQRRGWREV